MPIKNLDPRAETKKDLETAALELFAEYIPYIEAFGMLADVLIITTDMLRRRPQKFTPEEEAKIDAYRASMEQQVTLMNILNASKTIIDNGAIAPDVTTQWP